MCHTSACAYVSFMKVYGGWMGVDGASIAAYILFVQNLQHIQSGSLALDCLSFEI